MANACTMYIFAYTTFLPLWKAGVNFQIKINYCGSCNGNYLWCSSTGILQWCNSPVFPYLSLFICIMLLLHIYAASLQVWFYAQALTEHQELGYLWVTSMENLIYFIYPAYINDDYRSWKVFPAAPLAKVICSRNN